MLKRKGLWSADACLECGVWMVFPFFSLFFFSGLSISPLIVESVSLTVSALVVQDCWRWTKQ